MRTKSVKYLSFLVLFYMLAALTWWTILLLKFNSENYSLQHQAVQSENIVTVQELYDKNRIMILGEGIFFGLALVAGVYLLYRSYNKEVQATQRQNNFLLSVTHELKTPLSVIKLTNETMTNRDLERNKQKELLNSEGVEIERLESLIDNLLLATKLDSDETKSLAHTDLNSLIKKRAKIFEERYPERVFFKEGGVMKYALDEQLFSKAIDNLIDNALKYSEGKVHITIEESKSHFNISVSDSGNGIPLQERAKVFEKFYRLGDENVRRSKGTGLGLYLVKTIVEDHNGKIILEDNHPKGSIFTIKFPKAS